MNRGFQGKQRRVSLAHTGNYCLQKLIIRNGIHVLQIRQAILSRLKSAQDAQGCRVSMTEHTDMGPDQATQQEGLEQKF